MKPIMCMTLMYAFRSTVKSEEVCEVTAVTASKKSRFKRSNIRRVFLALLCSLCFLVAGSTLLLPHESCLGLRSDDDPLCKRSMLTFWSDLLTIRRFWFIELGLFCSLFWVFWYKRSWTSIFRRAELCFFLELRWIDDEGLSFLSFSIMSWERLLSRCTWFRSLLYFLSSTSFKYRLIWVSNSTRSL